MNGSDQKTVVVVGYARNGTSVVTSILKALGVDVGPDVRMNAKSPTGDMEDQDFVDINTDLYKKAVAKTGNELVSWEDIEPFVNEDEIKKIVKKKNEQSLVWGWKHTLNMLTFEAFKIHLKNPHLVVVSRNIKGASESAKKQTGQDLLQIMKQNNHFSKQTLKLIEKNPNLPILFISFEELLENPKKEINKLANFLSIQNRNKVGKAQKVVVTRKAIRRARIIGHIKGYIFERIPRFLKLFITSPKQALKKIWLKLNK